MLLATKNKHKLEEMRHALAGLGVELRSAFEFVELPDIEEDQDTLEGNALKKARETYALTGLMSVADDTGLEVAALGGRPGVWSARYAGHGASYAQNVDKLLAEMAAYPDPAQRKARFRTVIAVAGDAGEWVVEGVCAGEILSERRGDGGFGYDPVFRPEGYERSFAQMSMEEKNVVSHRGRALKEFVGRLGDPPLSPP
jgi:XTP/dITP diphosphohydrolase